MLDGTDLRVYVNHIKTIIHKTKVALAVSIAPLCPTFVPASLRTSRRVENGLKKKPCLRYIAVVFYNKLLWFVSVLPVQKNGY